MEVKRTMNSKTKAFTIILASIVACMLIYLPLIQAVQPSVGLGDELAFAEMEEYKPAGLRVGLKVRFVWWFLNHSESVEVDGKVVTLTENMLILSTGEDQTRVHLPAEWTVDNEVLMREELFASGYLSEGESITVKALGADLIDKEGLHIYLLVGYEIIDDAGAHAYANLHVNIET
jgi:RNase P/RNase MRP subunit p29